MQRILRIKQRRSISRAVLIKTAETIELLTHARCFAALCMTAFIVGGYFIPEQVYYLNRTSCRTPQTTGFDSIRGFYFCL